jgi:hypothetical protein
MYQTASRSPINKMRASEKCSRATRLYCTLTNADAFGSPQGSRRRSETLRIRLRQHCFGLSHFLAWGTIRVGRGKHLATFRCVPPMQATQKSPGPYLLRTYAFHGFYWPAWLQVATTHSAQRRYTVFTPSLLYDVKHANFVVDRASPSGNWLNKTEKGGTNF